MDAAGRTGADNPLTKEKVREAIFHAIDRPTMAKQLMQGGSRAIDAPCYPDAVRLRRRPRQCTIRTTRRRRSSCWPRRDIRTASTSELVTSDLPQWAGAMQGYLKAVGINVKLSVLQVGAFVQRSLAGQNPFDFGSWGSYSVNDVSAILPNFFTFTGNDYTRDPELKKLVEAGSATVDPDQRRKAYSAAIKLITEKAYWMPMFTHSVTYGFSKQLNFKPYPDELPRFFLASWK